CRAIGGEGKRAGRPRPYRLRRKGCSAALPGRGRGAWAWGMAEIKGALIGGTGLGDALGGEARGRAEEIQTRVGKTGDRIVETAIAGLPVFVLARHGPGHLLNPSQVPYRANVFALKQLGVTHILASGAVGSLREEMRPRDLVIPDQLIDKTTKRAG